MSDPLDRWPDFAARVRERLEAGRTAYGDQSFAREPAELLGELQQEALDLAGWGFVLFQRLEAARIAATPAAAEMPAPGPPSEFDAQASRAGVQVTADAMAELVAAAEALRHSPSAVLLMSLKALRDTLAKSAPRRVTRLVGKERGALEGKR